MFADRDSHFALGWIRMMMALFVVFGHASPIYELSGFADLSMIGVWVFFVISGFIIFYAYFRHYEGREQAFLINRALRIYPTLWATYFVTLLAFYVLATPAFGHLRIDRLDFSNFSLAITAIAANAIPNGSTWDPIPAAWSIHVELKFYVIVTALFFLSRMLPAPIRALMLYLSAAAFMALYIVIDLTNGYTRFYGEFKFSPFFILGACIFYLKYWRFKTRPGRWACWVLTILAGLAAGHYIFSQFDGNYMGFDSFDSKRVKNLVVFAAAMMAIAAILNFKFTGKVHKIDTWLGDLTYPLYLSHDLFISFVMLFPGATGVGYFAITLTICLIGAWLINRLVERPVYQLRASLRHSVVR